MTMLHTDPAPSIAWPDSDAALLFAGGMARQDLAAHRSFFGDAALAPSEQIAELVEELGVVVAESRVSDLVGLFERVRNDRPNRLDPVPRTVSTQLLGELLELDERVGQAHVPVVDVELVVYCAHGSGLGA